MPNAVTFPAPCSTIVEQPQAPTVEQPRLHYPTGPPLDFSFQELSDIAELPSHEVNDPPDNAPASTVSHSAHPHHPHSPSPSHLQAPLSFVLLYLQHDPSGLRLAYNRLTGIDLLPSLLLPSSPLLSSFPASPLHSLSLSSLHWLDLSNNLLPSLPPCLHSLPLLSTLYFHSNLVTSLASLTLLLPLPHLTRLTLHGNPVTQPPKGRKGVRPGEVRLRVLGVLARKDGRRVKELDFVGVTEREVAAGVRLVEGGERKRVKRRVAKKKVGEGEGEEEEQ